MYIFITILFLIAGLITFSNVALNISNAKNSGHVSGIFLVDTVMYGIAIALLKADAYWFGVIFPIFIVQILIYYLTYKIAFKIFSSKKSLSDARNPK